MRQILFVTNNYLLFFEVVVLKKFSFVNLVKVWLGHLE